METRQAINRRVIELDLCAKFEKLSVKTILQSDLHQEPYIARCIMANECTSVYFVYLISILCRKVHLLITNVFNVENANVNANVEYFIQFSPRMAFYIVRYLSS